MERRFLLVTTLAFVFTIFFPPTAHADGATQQLVDLVNAERVRAGVGTLTVSSELGVAAQSYAHEMASEGFFSHVGPDGSTLATRDAAAGYRGGTYLEENLAAGYDTPEQVINGWLNSSDHRRNLLSPNVTEIGVGHVDQPASRYGSYWVAEFGARAVDSRISQRVSSRGASRSAVIPSAPLTLRIPTVTPTSIAASQPKVRPASLFRSFGFEDLGRPLTVIISDPVFHGQTVQYFQRGVLEWHPENPAGHQVERRLIGAILYPTDPPVSRMDAPPGPSEYFPLTPERPTGLGHFVADFTRGGQPIYFKQYFDSHHGVAAFGYPIDEPFLRDGLWTQRFQAAVLQYHPEYDRDGVIPGTNLPWRYFRVQPRLLGEQYVDFEHLPFHD